MIIGSKAAINEKQLSDRKEKGSNWFEVHTDYRDIINLKETISKKNILEKIGLKPYCIHAPMYDENKNWLSFVTTNKDLYQKSFSYNKKSIIIANELCDYPNPFVVTHVDHLISLPEFKSKQQFKDHFKRSLTEMNEFLIKKYPHITLLIENLAKIDLQKTKEKEITITPYYYFVEIKECFDEIKPTNIGFVLDICHLESSCLFDKLIPNEQSLTSIYEIIYMYKDYLKLFHLSKSKNFALRQHEHGTGFRKEDQEDLAYIKTFLLFLKFMGYEYPITIETKEDDILNGINYKSTKEAIETANKQLNNIFNIEF